MLAQMWRLTMLGRLQLERGEYVSARFRTQKGGGLLAYLACNPQRGHPREELIERFWPESSLEDGRRSLRVALTSLRQQLEPPGVEAGSVLAADRANIRLNPQAVQSDVAEFENCLRLAQRGKDAGEQMAILEAAIAIYQGDFLPGFYDDWVLTQREHLRQSCLGALRKLTELALSSDNHDLAIISATRWAEMEPGEDAQFALMRAYAQSGRNAEALRQFDTMRRVLRDEFDVEPSQEARRFAQHLREQFSSSAETLTSPVSSASPIEAPGSALSLPVSPAPPAVSGSSSAPLLPSSRDAQFLIPLTFSRFFGRETEKAQLHGLLESPDTRLLTLTGPGGAGKTRLSLEVARNAPARFAARVGFVALADVAEADLIPAAIAAALHLPRASPQEPMEQIAACLAGKPALLILDNFEQLAEAGSVWARRLMDCAPLLTLLVTSRQTLNLEGEQEYPLSPLPTPTQPETPERLMRYAGVQMFVDRAQRARPDFQLTPRNAEAVAALCSRLEGIPLAIELAAGWARALTPAQMLERLTQRFQWLVSRRRDIAPRHLSLRAAMDWSYRLLPADLQAFWTQLCVFRGGWTVEIAQNVCEEPNALEFLLRLQECSLVVGETIMGEATGAAGNNIAQDNGIRFRLLETLREYAGEQMDADALDALRLRHFNCFLALAEEAEPYLKGVDQSLWLDRLTQEHDNFRAALRETPSLHSRLRLCGALWRFWERRDHFREGRAWLEDALAQQAASVSAQTESGPSSATSTVRVKALNGVGGLAFAQGDYEAAKRFHTENLALCRQCGDRKGEASALNNLGNTQRAQHDYKAAQSNFEQALAIYEVLGDTWAIGAAQSNLGLVALSQSNYELATRRMEAALQRFQQVEDAAQVALVTCNLGNVALEQRCFEKARDCFETSLRLNRRLKKQHSVALLLHNLAEVAYQLEGAGAAAMLFAESLRLRLEMGSRTAVPSALAFMGRIMVEQNQMERAACLLATAQMTAEATRAPLSAQEQAQAEQDALKAQSTLGAFPFRMAWQQGEAMQIEEAIEFAILSESVETPVARMEQEK